MKNKVKEAYYRQKSTAKDRSIEFCFTLDEWVIWWEKQLGPFWFTKRGCKKGQYVMARYYDDGPYAAHNVKCIRGGDNIKEWWKARGKGRQVKQPFPAHHY